MVAVPLLVVPSAARADPELLVDYLATHGVTRLTLVPSLLRAMLEVQPDIGVALPRLRWWTLSGEALPTAVRSFFPSCDLVLAELIAMVVSRVAAGASAAGSRPRCNLAEFVWQHGGGRRLHLGLGEP